ncbi:UNVERIFIED_CONTAM: hypothetical protein Sindi_1661500 [Sesamum indicum]
MDALRGVTDSWRKAREDLRSPYHRVAELEGNMWVPDWKISPSSTVFKTLSGQDSWELYDASCLPRDQAALLQTTFTRLEEHCAHSLIQPANFVRGLSLKCSGFRQNQLAAEHRSRDLRIQLLGIASREREWDNQRSAMEVAKARDDGEKVGFDVGHAAGKIASVIEGQEVFLRSEEFANRTRETRLQAARDFLKALAFESALEIKAAEFLMREFDRCKAQVSTLNGFALGFDAARLGPGLDSNLQPFPEEETPAAADDEFAVLLDKLDEN